MSIANWLVIIIDFIVATYKTAIYCYIKSNTIILLIRYQK